MVKGISRRVIVVDSPDPHIFEQAIFIVRNEAASGGGVTSQQLVDQAVRIAKNYARTHGGSSAYSRRSMPAWLWAVLGAAAIGLVWLVVYLV